MRILRPLLYFSALLAVWLVVRVDRVAPPPPVQVQPSEIRRSPTPPATASSSAFHARFGSAVRTNEPVEVIVPAATLKRLYSLLLEGPNPGYSNILVVLDSFPLGNALDSDLYKDACLYVALRTNLKGQAGEMAKHHEQLRARHAEITSQSNGVDAQFVANGIESLNQIEGREMAEWGQVQQALDLVFASRFKMNYGIEDPAVLASLQEVELENAGPELAVPLPQ